MAVLYKKKKVKAKNGKAKNALSDFDDKVNHRTHEFKLKRVPFIQTK